MKVTSVIGFVILMMIWGFFSNQALCANQIPGWQLVDSSGVPRAWLQDDGNLYISGNVYYSGTISDDVSKRLIVKRVSILECKIVVEGMNGGNLYLTGNSQNNPTTGPSKSHSFYVTQTGNPTNVLLSIDNSGTLHLKNGSSSLITNAPTARASYLAPWDITVRTLSPIFPTPNNWSDLPAAFQGENLTALSPLNILSMFVFYPNMNWDETTDGFNNPGYLHQHFVNDTGTNWGPITYSTNGDQYIMGGDGVGLENGVALFNRKFDQNSPTYSRWVERDVYSRIKSLVPGNYNGTRTTLGGGSRGKVLGWYHPDKTINLHSYNTTNPSEFRPGTSCSLFSSSLLYLNGNLYKTFFEALDENIPNKISVKQTLYRHHGGGILRIKNIDNWRSDHTKSYAADTSTTGREWEFQYPGSDKSYIHILKPDHTYMALDSSTTGSVADQILNNSHNNFLWNGGKFVYPAFIQFGKGYVDYKEPSSDNLASNQRYVYAISAHCYFYGEDALYLGRCKVTLGTTGAGTDQWGSWEYFSGVNVNGNPIWISNVDYAKSILYGQGTLSHAQVIYEKNTGLYILTAPITNNSQHQGNCTWHYTIYASRKPWGPWREIFTNDYNGMTNRAAQDMRNQGGAPDNVFILPDPVNFSIDPSTGVRTLRLWLEFGELDVFSKYILYGRTGLLISAMANSSQVIPWDEYFKQTYYVPCFQQVELTVPPDIPTTPVVHLLPAAVETRFPDYRPEGQFHFDHWGWRASFNPDGTLAGATTSSLTFSLDSIWFGHRFKAGPRDIQVSQLGRFYVSGNTLDHVMAIATTSTNPTVIASTTVSNGGKMFEPPSNIAQDGYIYAPLTYTNGGGSTITLTANQEYYLLSREGISSETMTTYHSDLAGPGQGLKYASIEYTETTGTVVTDTNSTSTYVGYRFRTGPLGLRVVGLLGWHGSHSSGNRSVVIEEAKTQTVNTGQNIFSLPIFTDSVISSSSYSLASSVTRSINGMVFDLYDCVATRTTIDLKPLTEYYIGMELRPGDSYYKASGTNPYNAMAKLRLNPNVMQFIHPTTRTLSGGQWASISRTLRPSATNGTLSGYDDGVGLNPAVELPVGIMAIVPDRFDGYRQPVGADGTKASPYFGLPMIKNLNTNASSVKVVNSVILPSSGYYGKLVGGVNQFGATQWNSMSVQNTLGPENSTFGPLDLVLKNPSNTVHLLSNNSITDYYNASSFVSDNSKTKVRTSENNWFIRPSPIPTPIPLGTNAGVYSGMQIRVLQNTTITQVGRYFPPGLSTSTLNKHKVIVMRGGGDTVAIGQIESYNGDFAYATLHVPPASGDPYNGQTAQDIALKQGELYFIGTWDGKENDADIGNKSYGWIEDYCRYKTGSALQILGPTRETAPDGDLIPGSMQTTLLDSTGAVYPQGYGPLNMIYKPVANTGDIYRDGFPLVNTATVTTYYAANSMAGFVAHKITVGASPVMVTHLGRLRRSDNSGRHQVCLVRVATGAHDAANCPSETVASVIVDANQAPEADGFNYEWLEKPVVLQPGESYYLASAENTFETGTPNSQADLFPSAGTCTTNLTNLLFGTGFTLDMSHNYQLNTNGTWSAVAFAPIANLKIN